MSENIRAVASLWIGAPLSYVEIVCLKSFVDAGHHLTLYTLDPLENVPSGINVRAAREIFSPPFEVGLRRRHNNAVYSDLFRLHLLQQRDVIWVDADAYCLRPFTQQSRYFFAYERHKDALTVATGVLGLPANSEALRKSIALAAQVSPIPAYLPRAERERMTAALENGATWGIEALTWGASGPMLLDYFLRETGEIEHAMDPETLYPGPRAFRKPLLRVPPDMSRLETPSTLSIHIFGKTKRFLLSEHSGLPPEGSYLDVICKRHDVDPRRYPISQSELENIERQAV